MGNRVSYQVVNPPCPPSAPKKDDKPKVDPVTEAFTAIVAGAAMLFFGVPLFVLLLKLAVAFWMPHSYRCCP